MIELAAALVVFVVAHMVPAMPGVRARLIASVGRTIYLTVYSLVSLALLAWLVVAARRAEVVELWTPAAWQWVVPVLAMPLSAFLIAAGVMQPNPLSVSLRKGDAPGPIVAVTRHPLPWGFLIWALAHVPPNGRVASLILFGGMAALAAAGLPLLDRKAKARLGARRWEDMARDTSSVPFAAVLAGRTRLHAGLLAPAAIALALYLWFLLQGHAWLIGPDPWAGLRALLS